MSGNKEFFLKQGGYAIFCSRMLICHTWWARGKGHQVYHWWEHHTPCLPCLFFPQPFYVLKDSTEEQKALSYSHPVNFGAIRGSRVSHHDLLMASEVKKHLLLILRSQFEAVSYVWAWEWKSFQKQDSMSTINGHWAWLWVFLCQEHIL